MTDKCPNCNGEGLAGTGDQPWLKQGQVKTCPVCKGTGKANTTAVPEHKADFSPSTGEKGDIPVAPEATPVPQQ